MRKNRLQNKVAGSVFTLPVCAVLALVLWFLPTYLFSYNQQQKWIETGIGCAFVAVITYILVELNNRNLLLRIRSRMVSSVWLVAVATVYIGHGYSTGLVLTFCMVAAYYLLFRTYEEHEGVVNSFHYAFFLGVGSIFVPHAVVCLPLFLWHQTVFLRSTTLRTFCAVLIGFLFPIMVWCSYWVFMNDYSSILAWVDRLITYQELSPEVYLSLTVQQAASWLLVSFLGVIGMLHFLATSYNDKIKVRMLYYILSIQFVVICSFGAAQPTHISILLPLLAMTASPLIAHFFALTSSWFTNALFVLNILLFGGLVYLNVWMAPYTIDSLLALIQSLVLI